ncbi:hypothetical protein M1523_03310 [Patescibacteria group bacterium]|nr:hypothetical protein [Patescibacteria group bacterium]MCL5091250.1 hypothetical protein [Patescibacteria group bacterium]
MHSLCLVYLGVQAPFSRYFLLILPFAYLAVVHMLRRWLIRVGRTLSAHFLS